MIESALSVAMPSPEDSSDSGRKINQHLVRALNSRKKKMRYPTIEFRFLFDCLEEFQQVFVEQESLLKQITDALESNNSTLMYSKMQLSASEMVSMPSGKKIAQKKNRGGEDPRSISYKVNSNIFKRNSSIGSLKPKVFEQDKIKLPSIAKRNHETESVEKSLERIQIPVHSQIYTEPKREKYISTTVDTSKKVCRIPKERLIPLSMNDIKQRIERKFK